MSARYWTTVAPPARTALREWKLRAQAIADPALRALALQKLNEEGLNVALAPTFATIAPRAHRRPAVQAIVALQIIYDLLDGLGEQPGADPLRTGERLFAALSDAVSTLPGRAEGYYAGSPRSGDGGYLEELVKAVQSALSELPRSAVIGAAVEGAVARVAGAQVKAHAVSSAGAGQLEEWAARSSEGGALEWREFLAGAAASVIAMHALIAAAADPRTSSEHAAQIDALYTSISAVATMLDSAVDYERDLAGRELELGYLRYYQDPAALTQGLLRTLRRARAQLRGLPHEAHHFMTLVGVVAYYTSDATAQSAKPLAAELRPELGPLLTPTRAFLRAWRATEQMRSRQRSERPASVPGELAPVHLAAPDPQQLAR